MSETNPFLDAARDMQKENRARREPDFMGAAMALFPKTLRTSLDQAIDTNPDRQAEIIDLSTQTRLPSSIVEANLEDVKRRSRIDRMERVSGPTTSGFLSKPENAKLAHDDVESLSTIENLLAGIGERGHRTAVGFNDVVDAVTTTLGAPSNAVINAVNDLFGLPEVKPAPGLATSLMDLADGLLGNDFRSADSKSIDLGYEEMTSWQEFKDAPLRNFLPFALEQGIVSAPDMALALVNLPTFAASMTGRVGRERAVNDGRNDPTVTDLLEAMPFAVASAFLERLGARGMLGIDDALGSVGALGVAKASGKAAIKEGVTEGAQETLESIGGTVGTERGFDLYETLDQALAGIVGGSGLGGTVRAGTATLEATIRHRQAQKTTDAIKEINAVDSRLRERAPETYAEFQGRAMADQGIEEVHISAEGVKILNQEYGQFDVDRVEAVAAGSSLQMTPEQYWTLPKEAIDRLAEYTSFTATELSEAEANEAEKLTRALGTVNEAEIQKAMAGIASENEIFTEIYDQLVATGGAMSAPESARAGALQMAAAFTVMADRAGVDPMVVAERWLPPIRKELPRSYTRYAPDQQDYLIDRARRVSTGRAVGISDENLFGKSLIEWIASRGGIVDTGGELTDMGLADWHREKPFRRRVLKEVPDSNQADIDARASSDSQDLTPDYVREAAIEAGYLPEEATIDDLIQAIAGELSGTPTHVLHDADTEAIAERDLLNELIELIDRNGIDLAQDTQAIKAQLAELQNTDKGFEQSGSPFSSKTAIAYRRSVDAIATGEPARSRITIEESNSVLSALGKGGPLYVNPSIIRKVVTGKHSKDLDPEIMRRLPRLLESPLAVVEDRGRYVFVLDAVDKNGNQVVAVIGFDGGINSVVTVHGRTNPDYVNNRIVSGGLKYLDKEKGRSLYQLSLATIEGGGKGFEPETRYITQDDIVKKFYQGEAQRNSLGLFSGVEKAILDMQIPAWKALKPDVETDAPSAKGSDILAKLKTMQVKKEEMEWLGIEEFLTADPGAKFSREEVAQFVRNNGVQVLEVVADSEGGEATSLVWDGGEAWEDNEAWEWRVEDYVDDPGMAGIDVDDERGRAVLEIIEDEKSYIETAIGEDASEEARTEYVEAEFQDEIQAKLNDIIQESAEERARTEYFDNPIYIYSTSGESAEIELYIFGNDDQGYDIRQGSWQHHSNVVASDIWSLNEAEIQAEDYARDHDLLTSEDSPETARWGEYVMDGYQDNYRELKLTLPEIKGDFYNETHFPDRNIVAFLRVDDRELFFGDSYREEVSGEIYEYYPYDDQSRPVEYAIKVTENGKERNITGYGSDRAVAERALENFQMLDGREVQPTKKTYFIDEFQSDWHQDGRQKGYQGQFEAKVVEIEDQIRDVNGRLLDDFGVSAANDTTLVDDATGDEVDPSSRAGLQEEWRKYQELRRVWDKTLSGPRPVADAPFKGDAWLALGLKRAIVDAVENGYEAIAWPNANVLSNRWSERYYNLYEMQYDKKMPSLVKKLTKQEPKHLTVDGDPYPDGKMDTGDGSKNDTPSFEEGYHIIEITPELKERVQQEGFSLFQPDGSMGPRGSIDLTDPNNTVINLFKSENLSTFLHESGHLYLEMMRDLSSIEGASTRFKEDYQTIRDWLGVKDGEPFTREQHEKFAETYEVYLREGKAPSVRLMDAFAKFSSWLTQIYRKLTRAGVLDRANLTPEVADVFDRMLATEDEIAEARHVSRMLPMFRDAETAGMTEAEYEAYKEEYEGAKRAQHAELLARTFRETKRETTKWWNAELELETQAVLKALDEDPVWLARYLIQEGRLPSGAQIPAYLPDDIKLSRDAIAEMEHGEALKYLPGGNRMYRKEGGLHPDKVAEMLGFTSGDEMLRSFMEMPKSEDGKFLNEKAWAKIEAERRMKETHGDILNDGTLHEEALMRVHSESQASLINREMKELAKLSGRSQATANRIMKEAAKRIIRDKQVGKVINHRTYLNAESRAAMQAAEAVARGDLEAAAEAKQRQLLNFHLYREARNAAEKADKMAGRLRDWQRKSMDPKKINPDFIKQVKELLFGISFGPRMGQARFDKVSAETLEQWARDQEAKYGARFHLPADLDRALTKQNYLDMSFQELEGLHDAAKSIIDQGRRYSDAEQAQFNSLVANIAESVNGNATKTVSNPKERGWWQKAGAFARMAFAEHRKIQSLSSELDGYGLQGTVYKSIFQRIKQADDRYIDRGMRAAEAMNAILDAYTTREKLRFYSKTFIPELNESLSLSARLSFALNMGNAGNVEAMQNEYSDAQVEAVLNTLTNKDWDVVEGIWRHIDTYWDDLAALEERTTGVRPPKVEAVPFTTPSGRKVAGGYYPLVADPNDTSSTMGQRDLEERQSLNGFLAGGHAKSSTKHGSTIERKGFGQDRKVWLDLRVAFEHVDGVIKDIELREAVREVHRIINHRDFVTAVSQAKGREFHEMYNKWLENVVGNNNQPMNTIEKIAQYARTGASIAEMGFSLRTILQQPFGITQSVVVIGEAYTAKGVAEFMAGRGNAARKVMEMSPYMRNRAATFNRDVKEASRMVGAKNLHDNLVNASFWGIQKFDMAVSVPTWLGAFQKAQDEGLSGLDAIDYADDVVSQSQGSGLPRELADIQQGAVWKRMFTMFYTFFNAYYNVQSDLYKTTNFKSPAQALRYAKNQIWVTVIPALLVDYLFNGGPEGDEEWPAWASKTLVQFLGSGIIGVRDAANAAATGYSYQVTPAGGLVKNPLAAATQIGQGEVDATLVKSLIMSLGYLGHVPGARVGARAVFVLDEEGTRNLDEFEGWWRLLVQGPER